MNDTSATSTPGAALLPEGTAAITTAHLTLIVVLAILVIAGILWGIRLKRTRVQAREDVRSNAEESGMPPAEIDASVDERVAPAPVAPSPVPVAPAPPPIADAPVMGVPDRLDDEPIAAAAPLDASPAAEAAASGASADAPAAADGPVTQLKGLGPKVATRLADLGITTVGQMAALSDEEAQALDAQLGSFTGRMVRDRWIEQARLLAAGDRAGFEAVFGKL